MFLKNRSNVINRDVNSVGDSRYRQDSLNHRLSCQYNLLTRITMVLTSVLPGSIVSLACSLAPLAS